MDWGGIASACLDWVTSRFNSGLLLNIAAVVGALLAVWFCKMRRKRCGRDPKLDKQEFRTLLFSGASMPMLLMIGVSAFDDSMYAMMLNQERTLIVLTIIFAVSDEWKEISVLWSNDNSEKSD